MGREVLRLARGSLKSRYALAALLVVVGFCAGLWPLAHDFYFAHVDEHLYADPAIRMVQSGDWSTPYYNTGYPRFQKPILTYWLIAASYRTFGISALTSRLPSILAGAATLLITYALTIRVTRRRPDSAILAMLILGSTPVFILAAIRANPDIFLTMFVGWSVFGFSGLMFDEAPSARDGWHAYLGAGLAIMAKGVPGLIFLGYVWLFAASFVTDWRRRSIPLLPLAVGLAIPATWFLASLHAHGTLFTHVMFNDQVRSRITFGIVATPLRILAMLAQYVLFFLPWCIVLVAERVSQPSPDSIMRSQFARFAAGFALLYAIVFGLNPSMNGHWLLPACPMLAAVIAGALLELDSSASRVALNATAAIVMLALAAFSVFAMLLNRDALTITNGLACAAFAVSILLAMSRINAPDLMIRVAVALFLFFPLASVLLRPWLLPDFGQEVAASIGRDASRIAFVGPEALASYIRVASGGTTQVISGPDLSVALLSGAPIVAPKSDAALLESHGYAIAPVGRVIERVSPGDVARAALHGDLGDFLESSKETFLLAIPQPPSKP